MKFTKVLVKQHIKKGLIARFQNKPSKRVMQRQKLSRVTFSDSYGCLPMIHM